MKKTFLLKYKDSADISPVEVFEENIHKLEMLCKQANRDGFSVVLHSPVKYTEPQNVYELSVILAEDLVMKFSDSNQILRD